VAGRQINASIDAPAFIQPDSDAATLTFYGHKLRIEKERLLLDGNESAKIAVDAARVDIVASNRALTVATDSKNIFSAQITK
jgi:hypothetical protein